MSRPRAKGEERSGGRRRAIALARDPSAAPSNVLGMNAVPSARSSEIGARRAPTAADAPKAATQGWRVFPTAPRSPDARSDSTRIGEVRGDGSIRSSRTSAGARTSRPRDTAQDDEKRPVACRTQVRRDETQGRRRDESGDHQGHRLGLGLRVDATPPRMMRNVRPYADAYASESKFNFWYFCNSRARVEP